MTSLEALRTNSTVIQAIAARHGAGNVRVFGSVARGEARPESDIDLLIDIVGPTTPWFPGGLLNDLERTLGRKVDIVVARSLNPLLRDAVLREAVPLCVFPGSSAPSDQERPRIRRVEGRAPR